MAAIEEVFDDVMDKTKFGYSYVDMSFQEKKVQDGLGLGSIFTLSAVFAFLIMAALYEKWTLPLAIFLTVPIAVLGAFLGLWMAGMDLNMYAQIGLVMLVGLAAKNAILMVEFSKDDHESGTPVREAALNGANLRFRAVMMTAWSFIIGVAPLVVANGAGSGAMQAIGICTCCGMIASTLVGIIFVPSMYAVFQRIREFVRGENRRAK